MATQHHSGSLHTLLAPASSAVADPSSSSAAYLASLSTQSLASLQAQPDLLASSSAKITEQLAALCTRHIGPLVDVQRAEVALPGAVGEINTTLDDLLHTTLPALAQVTHSFATHTQPPLTARRKARTLIHAHRSHLADVLDIPRLVAVCVRSGFHHEALRLAAHIDHLARREDPPFATLQALRDEAWASLLVMRDNLLDSLSTTTLRLPVAHDIIAHLRNLGALGGHSLALTDDELCLALLRARSHVLHHALASPIEAQRAAGRHSAATSQHIAAARIEAFIDVWKHGVHDAVHLAHALFASLPSLPSTVSAFLHLHVRALRDQVARTLPHLLESLHHTCVAPSSSSSRRQVAAVAGETANTLVALHAQLSFAAQGVVAGADLSSALLATGLDQAALALLREPSSWAEHVFLRSLPTSSAPPSTWLVERDHAERLLTTSSATTDADFSHFPPLATYLDDTLVGLDALAAFAPLCQHASALARLDASLARVLSRLVEYAGRLSDQHSHSHNTLTLPLLDGQHVATPQRYAQAQCLLAALAIEAFCAFLVPRLRIRLHVEVFGKQQSSLRAYGHDEEAMRWVAQVKHQWRDGEGARRAQVHDEQQRRRAEEAERERVAEEQRRVEEQERKRAEEQQERKRAEEEERKRAAEEEEEMRRAAQEERKRAAQEEEDRRKAEEERKKAAEQEEARQKAAAEEERKRAAEEERKRAEEEERKRAAEQELARQKAADEEARQKAAQEEARQKAAADEEARQKAERQKAEQETARRQKAADDEEEEARRKEPQQQEAVTRQQQAEAQDDETARQEARQEDDGGSGGGSGGGGQTGAGEEAGTAHRTQAAPTSEPKEAVGASDERQQQTTHAGQSSASDEQQQQTTHAGQSSASNEQQQQTSHTGQPSAPAPAPTPTDAQPKKLSLAQRLKARQEERERAKRAGGHEAQGEGRAGVPVDSQTASIHAGHDATDTATTNANAAPHAHDLSETATQHGTPSASDDDDDNDNDDDDDGPVEAAHTTPAPTPAKKRKNKKKKAKK